jgi:hypothetical protein
MTLGTERFPMLVAAVLILCVTAALPGALLAQAPKGTTTAPDHTPDPLGHLKQALSNAGATALTTSQETALTTLITNFRTANVGTASTTRLAFDNYILAGDAAHAIALIPALEAERNSKELARAEAEVTFAASAAQLLSVAQVSALQQKLGVDEVVRLIDSLAGGPEGPGGPH